MTSELRPEVEVASAVYDECRERGIRDGSALIKADREAVRAEQAADLAKFKALAETLAGKIWLFRSMLDHPDYDFGEAVEEFLSAVNPVLRQWGNRDAS